MHQYANFHALFRQLAITGCAVIELCTEFESNRAICGGVIAILMFDLMTLNLCLVLQFAPG